MFYAYNTWLINNYCLSYEIHFLKNANIYAAILQE